MKRYRFKTNAIEDFRPLKDMKYIQMPWWCTGESDSYVTIVCYLPNEVNLLEYWDDAYEIEEEDVDEITYSSRFPKPEWLD